MKRTNWVLLFLCFSLTMTGQKHSDYGVFAGVSSYFGDINQNRVLYSPSPAGGIFYRYNFNPRQAVRATIFFGGLAGNDLDFKNSFQVARAHSFRENLGELAINYEFNFFPYTTGGKPLDYSPYLAAGAGIALAGFGSSMFIPVFPFSFGFKLNILKNLGLEAEYGFRKTFYDNFDGLKDLVAPSDYALFHNNDWYSFTGISITWKIMSGMAGCPAYE